MTKSSSFFSFRTFLGTLLAGAVTWATPALAQDGEDPEASPDAGDADMSAYYGKVRIAGQSDAEDSSAETDFGLGRMYGGVSGQAGVYGKKAGGPRKNAPPVHTVEKGDTLWDLSATYYGNPWAWPQVWGLNPQIQNPHWIYPGDQIRTKPATSAEGLDIPEDNSATGTGMVGRGRRVPEGTVFIRDQGYIGDPDEDVWGEVVGAHEDQMLLAGGDTVYVKMNEGVDLRLGQRLTVFDAVADPPDVPHSRTPPGEIVKIYGTVRVDAWDRDTRIVKGVVIESLDTIERGFSVGPVGRRFDVIAPTVAKADVEARILNSLYAHIYFGENQLLFIDKGSEDGLEPGNLLRVLRRGDTWRRNLTRGNHHVRVRVEMGAPDVAPSEVTPLHGDDEKYPDEVVGEIQVLRTEDYSAICLVREASQPLKPGDRAVAVSGY